MVAFESILFLLHVVRTSSDAGKIKAKQREVLHILVPVGQVLHNRTRHTAPPING